MKVGGRDFDWTRQDVEGTMRGVTPEPIQKHVVEMSGTEFPPKQVLARVTGWARQSFTTMEAQRVLTKLGFDCHPVGGSGGGGGQPRATANAEPPDDRFARLEAALATAQEAIAGLRARVKALEQAR